MGIRITGEVRSSCREAGSYGWEKYRCSTGAVRSRCREAGSYGWEKDGRLESECAIVKL